MVDLSLIKDNFTRVSDNVHEATIKRGDNIEDVALVTVTKFVDIEHINAAVEAGATYVGENRVQEYCDKLDYFNKKMLCKNLIGQLQTNKVKYIIGKVDLIQSVDRMSLANEINRLSLVQNIISNLLIEVNIGHEEQKGGILPENLPDFMHEISQLQGVHVHGIMCVPPAVDRQQVCRYFDEMYKLFMDVRTANIHNVSMKVLSMGMSHDYIQAIECGANMVRVGSAIFGSRY